MLKEWIGKLWRWLLAPNLPALAGLGAVALGGFMLMLALKHPWYRVPLAIDDNHTLTYAKSSLETPFKALLLLGFLGGGVFTLMRWKQHEIRGRTLFSIGVLSFMVGLAFTHLTIVNEGTLSHRASWTLSQHDNLTWLGGDIYTAREYEPAGGGLDLMIKDPPQILGTVPLPHRSLDLAIIYDLFEWMGLGASFTAFKAKGWGFLMVGSIMLMVGALATRPPWEPNKVSDSAISFALRALGIPFLLYIALVGGRVALSAKALEQARSHGDVADYSGAAASIEKAMRWMPCIRYDTGLTLQLGLYHYQSKAQTAEADYYRAILLEQGNFKSRAERIYTELTQSDQESVRREAFRSLFRLGIIDFNSGQETEALRHTDALIKAFPALPKLRYARLLLAVRLRETEVAFDCQKALYTIGKGISRSEKRSYLSSGHQHLGELAFADGDYHGAWRQFVNRVELEK